MFWDTEIFMLPFFILTQPDTARALLRYRHHTLDGARANSREYGTGGARYAWESADTGREECPQFTPDGANRFWTREEEVHVSADVAYGIFRYVEATGDTAFLHDYGAEVLFETSRFWVDRVAAAPEGGYELKQVMGPDEFHSHIDNNAFTNRLAQWHLTRTVALYDELRDQYPDVLDAVATTIGLKPDERDRWQAVAEGIVGPRTVAGVIEQFTGYFDRDDIPITEWDENDMPRYPQGYHHFNCETTKLLKQPDVVMLNYLLPDEFSPEVKKANFEYYEARTLHKSSLSPSIHAIIGMEVGDTTRAVQYFERSVLVDLADNQGNTAEGMHIASAGGTWQILVNGFGGLRVLGGRLSFTPWLPGDWQGIRFRIRWRGRPVHVVGRPRPRRAAARRRGRRHGGGAGRRRGGDVDGGRARGRSPRTRRRTPLRPPGPECRAGGPGPKSEGRPHLIEALERGAASLAPRSARLKEGRESVDLYTLTNRNGLVAKITNFGGHLTELHVPDRNGEHGGRRARPQHAGGVPRPHHQSLLRLDRRPVRQPDREGRVHTRRQAVHARREQRRQPPARRQGGVRSEGLGCRVDAGQP